MKTTAIRIIEIIPLAKNDAPSLYKYHLDSPKSKGEYNSKNLTVAGWLLCRNNPAVKIEILTEEKTIATATFQVSRQDVRRAFPNFTPVQRNLGFSTTLELDETILGNNRTVFLWLRVVFADENKENLALIHGSFYPAENPGPDFIIIGSMKAATSAIYHYLSEHPRVISRYPKELHFFALNFNKGLDWYLAQFAVKRKNAQGEKLLTGEATPSYLAIKNAPRRIFNFFPQVKIIVSLRNPTDRAISHYYHEMIRNKQESRDILEAFSADELENLDKKPRSPTYNYLHGGKYILYLQRWLKIFPREQILILNYHELEQNPDGFIEKLFTFLNLEDYLVGDIEKIYVNEYPEAPISVKQRLDRYFKPYNEELENLLAIRL